MSELYPPCMLCSKDYQNARFPFGRLLHCPCTSASNVRESFTSWGSYRTIYRVPNLAFRHQISPLVFRAVDLPELVEEGLDPKRCKSDIEV